MSDDPHAGDAPLDDDPAGSREELHPLIRLDLDLREGAKDRHDERRAELAIALRRRRLRGLLRALRDRVSRWLGRSSRNAGDEALDVDAFHDAIAWVIEDELAEQGTSAVDVDALRELVASGVPPTRDAIEAALLVDEDEVAALMEPVRQQWAEGRSAEYAAALWEVSASDVLVRLVGRALERG